MISIRIEYSLEKDGSKSNLCMKALDPVWERQMPVLFCEVAESLLKSSYDNICFDFSEMKTVTSTLFGTCVNIVHAANNPARIKFRFSKDAAEIARDTSLDQLVRIEIAQ